METSALFSLGNYRHFSIASFLIISDVLKEKWDPQFSSKNISKSLDRILNFYYTNLDDLIKFNTNE